MRKLYFLFFLAFLPLVVSAQAVEIDGIYYNLNSSGDTKTAEVTQNPNRYSGDIVIPETVTYNDVTYSVTSIGNSAFYVCRGLTSVTIPNSVTTIGYLAFTGCSGLTSVTIPNSVTSIGNSAFLSCSGLTSVTIPNSVISVGLSPFEDCSELISVVVESDNPVYDSRDNCNAIIETSTNTLIAGCKNTIIPSSVISIGNSAFHGCRGLTSITIPKNVTSIDYRAFGSNMLVSLIVESENPVYDSRDNCNAIIETRTNTLITGCQNTKIPNSVAHIGNSAFYNCNGLKTLIIPEGVKTIGSSAFSSCFGLEGVELPSSLTNIGYAAFRQCTKMKTVISHITNPGGVLSSDDVFDSSSATLYVPQSSIDAYKATEGWSSFKNILPLEDMLANIEFADAKVKEICVANWDTNGDGELSMLEASLVNDLGNVFAQNNDIKSFDELRYFKGLTSLKATWFYGCYFLSAITIPENVKEIEDLLFYYCHFKSIGVDENNQNYMVDEGVLYNKAKSILVYFPTYREGEFTIPTGVTIINQHAFCGSRLSSVTIPDGVSTIKFRGFAGCQLSSIVIPKSVTSIASYAFSNCSKVSSIIVDEDNPVYDSRDNCNAIIETETNRLIQGGIPTAIPQSVTAIGQSAFSINSLSSIEIPNSVQTIETQAFMGAGLSFVKIPASITSIGNLAFACNQLKTVTVDGKEPCPIEQDAFPYRAESTLYVPTGCKAAYEAADYWKEFKNIFEIGEAVPITIGKSGKASYCGDKSLDFSFSDEVKAYIATGFDKDEGTIWLTRVKDVPAGVPVLIKGEANKTYDVPVTDSRNSYYTNMFVGNTSGEKIQIQETDGDLVNYYLAGDGTFKSVNKTANIGNNKCYLQLPETFEAAATGAAQTVKIGSIGKASFAAPVDLDFTNVDGLKAFTATGYDKSTKTIWLTRVMKVQKGEGVLLKGDPNSYEIPSAAVQSRYENMFVGNTSGDEIQVQETSEDGSQTNYYLSGKDGSFVSVNGYVNIKNNKCYLALPTSMVAVSSTRSADDSFKFEEPEVIKLPIDFKSIGFEGDGTTSIKEVKSGEAKSDEWFTLQGQRVAKPGKGVYIKNGKKVVIK